MKARPRLNWTMGDGRRDISGDKERSLEDAQTEAEAQVEYLNVELDISHARIIAAVLAFEGNKRNSPLIKNLSAMRTAPFGFCAVGRKEKPGGYGQFHSKSAAGGIGADEACESAIAFAIGLGRFVFLAGDAKPGAYADERGGGAFARGEGEGAAACDSSEVAGGEGSKREGAGVGFGARSSGRTRGIGQDEAGD